MSLDIPLIGLGLALGAVCGFFNAVASGGSAVMFPALLAIGIPADIANATSRLPILLGSTTALWSFERAKLIPWQSVLRLSIVFLPFSLLGAEIATVMNTSISLLLIRISILMALVFLLIRPQQLLKRRPDNGDKAYIQIRLSLWLLTAFCGFWAGLIIVDAAIFLLLSLVLVGGVSLRQAVPVKTGLVFLFSISTFLIFARSGKVEWQIGIPMVIGSIFGSLIGAKVVMSQYANQWVYRCLIVVVLIESVRLFL
ncbi:sulfite exporter TauE/SafE family protein [Synechococcus sp. RS9916]|uniref:sulfite exporter TauE/SafE family protein n=1 Tax=Synechococcus sp. RS9916 TaxID=221359 RepID=UPI0000E537CB|nr:sulfite exporter TauE/SafE family protein [Synechococcus sp. RS9916]EAU74843.1 hypothetical protein RS9916_35087 [Synechococcus sp. RS9916]